MAEPLAADYAAARAAFLDAATAAGATLAHHRCPADGPGGEALFTDAAVLGPAEAEQALVVASGTHGAEGFAGSAIQAGWLRRHGQRAAGGGIRVLLLHALNPFGFAHLRRVNEDNVDLNRNFVDHAAGHPENPRYARLEAVLDEAGAGDAAAAEARLAALLDELGPKGLLAACSGQYGDADGLFYGGRTPAWSNRTVTTVVAAALPAARRVAYVDLHTGLGPHGYGEPIGYHPPGSAEHALAARLYGAELTTPHAGTASAPVNTGKTGHGVAAALPRAAVASITLEFGTWPVAEVLGALTAEHWLWRHSAGAGEATARAIKARFRRAFCPDTDEWAAAVLARGEEILGRALAGLAED